MKKSFDKKKFRGRSLALLAGLLISAVSIELFLYIFFAEKHEVKSSEILKSETENSASNVQHLRIMTLGESMTALGGDHAWPVLLEAELNFKKQNPDKNEMKTIYSVHNAAKAGYRHTAGFFSGEIERLLDENRPHIVIMMLGIDDLLERESMIVGVKRGWIQKVSSFLRWSRVFRLIDEMQYYLYRHTIDSRTGWTGIWWRSIRPELLGTIIKPELAAVKKRLRKLSQNKENLKISDNQSEINVREFAVYEKMAVKLYQYDLYHELSELSGIYLEIDPQNKIAGLFKAISDYQINPNDFNEKTLEKTIEKNPERAWMGLHQLLRMKFYTEENIPQAQKVMHRYVKAAFSPVSNASVRKSYNSIVNAIHSRGIKLYCVQYPVLSLEPLKDMVDNSEVEFISLQQPFETMVNKKGFKSLFEDSFGVLFGHCNALGNEIIAEKIAEKLNKSSFF